VEKVLKRKALIIDDDRILASKIDVLLRKEGYDTQINFDGKNVIAQVEEFSPDLIILDWMLPTGSGLDICKKIRDNKNIYNTPILMLSVRGQDFEQVIGLDNGVDDFMAKPADGDLRKIQDMLLARAKALVRRYLKTMKVNVLKYNQISIDLEKHIIEVNGKPLLLPPIEFQIMQLLLEQPENIISREKIMSKIWGNDADINRKSIDVYIYRLKKSIANEGYSDIIKTVRTLGYKIEC
jgi:two-component system phosphate regulon response regulator PhoB